MATNDLAYPPSSSEPLPGTLPYPTTSANTPAYPPPAASGAAAPYPPQPQTQAYGGKGAESEKYTDAPPPYAPPPGGMPYPTGGQGMPYPTGGQGQMPPPQPGLVACPPSQAMPQQPLQYTIAAPGAVTVTTVTRTGQQQGSVIMAGNCSACGVGVVSENFTLVGLCCAFWLFPIGILCCYTMREKKCTSCGAVFA